MPPAMPGAMTRTMIPEDQLCLLLARGHLTPELRSRSLDLLATSLRWPLVLERAYSHQVYPLLYRNLCDLAFPGVPDPIQAELKSAYLANALRNQLLVEELARLLGLLGKAGVPAIPLKGVALAESLYGDASARVCSDIDIFVPAANVAQAVDLILASGYHTDFDDPFFSKLEMRHGRHYDLVRDGLGISFLLELHWKFVQYSSRDDDAVKDLWAEARPQICFGVPAFSLSPEWEFLYLSTHAAGHEWRSLKWLVDIHHIASCGQVDWQKVMNKTRVFELELAIRQTLAACSLLLETQLPAHYSPVSLPAGVRLFPYVRPAGDAKSAFAFRHMRLLKRPLDKLRYIAVVLFVPRLTDRDLLPLPSSMAFLYYFLRPVRLLGKWGWVLLQACFKRGLGSASEIARDR